MYAFAQRKAALWRKLGAGPGVGPMMLPLPLIATTSLLLGCAHGSSPEPAQERDRPQEASLAQVGGNVEVRRPDPVATVADNPSAAEVCRDDPRIRACRVHRASSERLPLDLGAGHGRIALLYAEVTPTDQGQGTRSGASMILHDRALTPTGEVRVTVDGWLRDLSLAATADGWLVALAADDRVHLVELDADGHETGARQVIDDASTPRLVADGPRTPLLAWDRGYDKGFMAQGVVLRGAPPPVAKLFATVTEATFDGQIAVAPGEFLVARRAGRGIEVRRVSASGQLRSHHADVGANTEYPTLARCDDGARMVWSDFSGRGEIRWARLTEDGAVDGPTIRLSGIPDHFNHSPAVCDGVDTMVLLAGYTGGTGLSRSLDLVRVDARGQIRGEALPLHGDPTSQAYEPTMLRDGDALFVAWATRGVPRIALSRVDLQTIRGPAIAR